MAEPSDMLTRIEKRIDQLGNAVQEVRDFFIEMKARDVEARVNALTSRVDALEDAENRRAGARGMFEFITKNGPGFVMMIIIFALGLLTYKGIIAR